MRVMTGAMIFYVHGLHKLEGWIAYLRYGTPWKLAEEVAEMHVPTVNTWMKRRILPYLKVGRIVRFNLIACDAAMQKYQTQGRN